jgi:hypothetical protein
LKAIAAGIQTQRRRRTEMANCRFATVDSVKIVSVTPTHVTFITRSAGLTEAERIPREYEVESFEILGSTPAGGPAHVELKPNEVGVLYLSDQGWTVTSGGHHIFGVPLPSERFKWPECGGGDRPDVDPLTVIPSRIELRGFVDGSKQVTTIDLLAPEYGVAQKLEWNSTRAFDIQTKYGQQLSVWPTALVITGAPQAHPDLTGSVDLLDDILAAPTHELAWRQPGDPIVLRLTQDGFSRFGVVPEFERALAAGRVGRLDRWTDEMKARLAGSERAVLEAAIARLR